MRPKNHNVAILDSETAGGCGREGSSGKRSGFFFEQISNCSQDSATAAIQVHRGVFLRERCTTSRTRTVGRLQLGATKKLCHFSPWYQPVC